MINTLRVFLLIVFISLLYTIGHAQLEQVEWIDDIYEITHKLRYRSGVFKAHKAGFKSAKLFYERGEGYVVKLNKHKNGNLFKLTFKIDEAELDNIRSQLNRQLSFVYDYDQKMDSIDSRFLLVLGNLGNGVMHGGLLALMTREFSVSVDTLFISSGNPAIRTSRSTRMSVWNAALIAATPAIYTASTYYFTQDKHIRPADVNMYAFGSLLGYVNGIFIGTTIKNDRLLKTFEANRLEYGLLMGSSLMQGWLSYHISKDYNFTYSQSVGFNTGSIWGMLGGYLITDAISSKRGYGGRALKGVYTVGSSISGGVLANVMHKKRPRTTGDYRFINSAALIGMSFGGAIFENVGPFEQNMGAGLGALSGLMLGYAATKYTKFTSRQGNFNIYGATLGGALGGISVGFLSGGISDHTLKHIALGSLTGWLTHYFIVKKRNKKRYPSINTFENFWGLSVDVSFNPGGFIFLNTSSDRQNQLMQMNIYPSLLSLSVGL